MGNNHTADGHGAVIDGHTLDFLHKAGRDALHTPSEVGSLRSTAHFLWSVDFSPHVLRNRLNRCLAAKGLHTIITFDAQLDHPMLLKAIWLVDTQQWTEVADALKLAAQYGHCQLPVTCDLQRHDSKQAYSADVRVIALWKMVGRHVEFGGNYGRFELFDQPGGGVRALRDAPGFELDINPPLPPTHPYHPHIIDGNPPVRSSIDRQGDSWTAGAEVTTDASVSAFIMRVIMWPANWGGHAPVVLVDRHAHGGVLDGLMNHLPHSPPNGCSAVMAHRFDDMVPPAECRTLLLTPFDRPFVAWIDLIIPIETNTVCVRVVTTEPPVGDASDAFKDRRPNTAPLVGGLLGNTIADMAIYHKEEQGDDEDVDGESEDELDDVGGDGDGDGQQQQQQQEEEEKEG